MKNLVLVTQVGISLVTPILLGAILGIYIDKYLTTRWLFSLIFIVLGIISGFYNTYRLIMSLNTRKEGGEDDGK